MEEVYPQKVRLVYIPLWSAIALFAAINLWWLVSPWHVVVFTAVGLVWLCGRTIVTSSTNRILASFFVCTRSTPPSFFDESCEWDSETVLQLSWSADVRGYVWRPLAEAVESPRPAQRFLVLRTPWRGLSTVRIRILPRSVVDRRHRVRVQWVRVGLVCRRP